MIVPRWLSAATVTERVGFVFLGALGIFLAYTATFTDSVSCVGAPSGGLTCRRVETGPLRNGDATYRIVDPQSVRLATSGQRNSRSSTQRYAIVARDEHGARATLVSVPTSAEADANAFVAAIHAGARDSVHMVVDTRKSAALLLAGLSAFLAMTWTLMALRIRKRARQSTAGSPRRGVVSSE